MYLHEHCRKDHLRSVNVISIIRGLNNNIQGSLIAMDIGFINSEFDAMQQVLMRGATQTKQSLFPPLRTSK